ncbi:pilus assembly protein [Paralcaligenes sp. KSB-10]|uniref:TadE/TadG family type IV pilus assembly protein n=1 Tax=Paralcaligenes sp. KSB-10 TaxID=2901142 RepID=UPI001E4FF6C7|nr:TadE/TadG family type IV pilus assembly protein [Paralcaligenes sp. KSB-10]UHL65486.1 pilus assembly protein [Paralcaligenes sp. KSB-10]
MWPTYPYRRAPGPDSRRGPRLPARTPCKEKTAQRGTSLIEFSVSAIPILLIGMGSIELAQWFYVKQVVSVALLQAARAGITQHASPQAIEAAFEQALLPLYISGSNQTAGDRMKIAFARRMQTTGNPPWKIELLSPSRASFQDFADSRLDIARKTGLAAINNNYQAEQDQRYRALGWPQGQGPRSGLSIYQANVLALRVTYLHEPILPGMKALIKQLGTQSSYAGQAMAHGGYLPISQELELTMQSHPVDWPVSANRKIVWQHVPAKAQSMSAADPCHGLWCLNLPLFTLPGAVAPEPGQMPPDGTRLDSSSPVSDVAPAPSAPPSAEGLADGPAVAPDDPACGVALCCVGS